MKKKGLHVLASCYQMLLCHKTNFKEQFIKTSSSVYTIIAGIWQSAVVRPVPVTSRLANQSTFQSQQAVEASRNILQNVDIKRVIQNA